MSQFATSTKVDDTLRVSDWVNNSPVATARHHTSTAVSDPNIVTVTTAKPKSVNMEAPTTTPPPTFPVVTSVNPPIAQTTNDMPSVTGLVSIFYLPTTGPVQNPQPTTTFPRTSPLITATVQLAPTSSVPASHLLTNVSAWTFPTGPSNPHVSATPVTTNHTVIPTVFPATNVATKASPIIPVTAGGTVYYINPTSMTTVSAPNSTPVPSTFPTIPSTATQFAPPPFITAPQPATNCFTVQDLAQLLASSKRDQLTE